MDDNRFKEVRIRLAGKYDAGIIAEMDAACRARPGCKTDYKLSLGCQGFEAYIAEDYSRELGFVASQIYLPNRKRKNVVPAVRIWSFGVIPGERRQYVASQLFTTVKTLMRQSDVRQIEVEVPEESLESQLFLRSQNFRCVGMHKPVRDETWLKFVYRTEPTNRIAAYLTHAARSVT